MRKLTTREKLIFVLCLVLGAGYLGYYVVYLPINSKKEELDLRLETQNRKYFKDLRTIKQAELQQSSWKEYAENFQLTESKEEAVSSMLKDIESVANQLNLKISDQKPKTIEQTAAYMKFPISLSIDSDFITIVEFLHALQLEPYNFFVDEARFDKSSRNQGDQLMSQITISKIFVNIED